MSKNTILYVFFFLLSLISVVSLVNPGLPITHDGDVHLLRLTNFYQSLQEGIFIPRWAANVNYGYGQPVFEFFYPLPYYIASLLHFFGITFANSIKTILALSLLLSGYSMFVWLSKITSKNAAFLGSLLYIFAPFRFIDVYVRGDMGESLAFVFVPLIFYFFYQISQKITYSRIILGGMSLASLILCHNVISLMFLPFSLWYGILLWREKRSRALFISFISVLAIGFCLSAFFWIPGLLEGKFTLRNIVTAGEYKSRFITFQKLVFGPWSYGGSGFFSVQLGVFHWMAFIVSIITLPIFIHKKNKQVFFIISLLLFTLIGIFLMFPQSNFIWSKIPLLQNFQFPWRFLAIPVFSLSILAAFLFDGVPKKISLWIFILTIGLILFINHTYWNARGFVIRPDNFFSGIQNHPADTGESTPLWGVRFMEHNFKQPLQVISGNAQIIQVKRTSVEHTYKVYASTNVRLLENTLYFPGWKILVDNQNTNIEFQNQQYRGLMTFIIPSGHHVVKVIFRDTKLRSYSDMLSLVSFVAIIFICFILILWKKK